MPRLHRYATLPNDRNEAELNDHWTGATNQVDKQGAIFDARFRPGAGAWNELFGLAFIRRFSL